jgi:hypothetical protein
MHMRAHAILAVVMDLTVVLAATAGQDAADSSEAVADRADASSAAEARCDATAAYRLTPDRPVRVTVQLVNGHRLAGELSAWSDEGMEGSFGRHAWREIRHDDVWQVHRRVMDESDGCAWLRLGGVMLRLAAEQPEAAAWADRALRLARERSDEPVDAAIDALHAAVAAEAQARQALERKGHEERLAVSTPAAAQWPPTPWPVLSAAQERDATRAARAEAQRLLGRAGVDLPLVESDHFLLFADMTTESAERWSEALEVMYRGLGELLGFDESYRAVHGKAAVIVFDEQERFRLAEIAMFDQYTPVWVHGVTHAVGPDAYIVTHREQNDEALADELARQVARAVMHGYRSPRRLPLWANEGLVRYFAAQAFEDTAADLERRERTLAFIRGGGDVNAALSVTYEEASWPDADHLPAEIGHLMIELMMRERPETCRRWIASVKDGKNWEQALAGDYGVRRTALVATFTQYFTVNN